MDAALKDLLGRGLITKEDALRFSSHPQAFG